MLGDELPAEVRLRQYESTCKAQDVTINRLTDLYKAAATRASEAELSCYEMESLQEALKWVGADPPDSLETMARDQKRWVMTLTNAVLASKRRVQAKSRG